MAKDRAPDAVPAQAKHRPKRVTREAKERSNKKEKGSNPKAFAFQSGTRASRMGQRSQEMLQKRLHVPLVDRTGVEPPPAVVAVVGPPGTGKSTLIRSLVKRYTKHNLTEIKGPITVVAGKGKRLTFLECNNDVNSMLDVAKIADLVLLVIDASFGFEMETFEFLNMLQVHGFPKVMGILTHLDSFKESKRLRRTKKIMKQRFWTEVYQGAKLFYLSGVLYNRYLGNEILNLSRYINSTKYRPLIWRNAHPYVLADRIEDVTESQQIEANPKCDRKIVFYGYTRGTAFKATGAHVHVPGVGDFAVQELAQLPDPCPFPEGVKKRTLNYKEKLIYAPMSDLSGITYDKDAVYINMKVNDDEQEMEENENIIKNIDETVRNLQERNISLLSESQGSLADERVRRKVEFNDNLSDIEDDSDCDSECDVEVELENNEDESMHDDEIDFFATKEKHVTSLPCSDEEEVDLDDENELALLHSKFIGNDEFEQLGKGDEVDENDDDEEIEENELLEKKKEALKNRFDEEYDDSKDNAMDSKEEVTYYDELKESMKKQLEMNQAEFQNDPSELRQKVRGIVPGTYVRCILERVPVEFIQNFNPTFPVLLGGLLSNEMNLGFVQARIKRHRWHGKILKSNEPLIFSMGWRRFQSIPLYSLKDATRNRLLKYTPEHMHCMATFYGPVTLPNTGLCAFRSLQDSSSGSFRMAATGVILEIDQGVEIVKKLKLVGYPMEVHKNTAFIRDMFNSALEVAKFEGASLRTVAGIRGQIKRAIHEPDGAFRATFEDKILMSDIAFLRCWYPVFPRKFYNPLCNLLSRSKHSPTLMRLNSEVRKDLGISVVQNPDSIYKPVERPDLQFNPLQIPKSLERQLPFAYKSKHAKNGGGSTARAVILEPEERKANKFIQQLATINQYAQAREIEKQKEKQQALLKQQREQERAKEEKHAKKRKKIYIKEEQTYQRKQASKLR